jgi:hypothetical protein
MGGNGIVVTHYAGPILAIQGYNHEYHRLQHSILGFSASGSLGPPVMLSR